ncbi:MAG: hypothetical protein HC908_17245 [Calothrix sp. SM1_7_51]|nr:hypothetical protein [Calothrix sp. SM1_7_51]
MIEQSTVQQPVSNEENASLEVSIIDILKELQETPKEHWANLLQIIRLFRESVTLKAEPSNSSQGENQEIEADVLMQQHKALSQLNQEWIEEGDEQEQTETWKYLHQKLDEDRLSNRPLFS